MPIEFTPPYRLLTAYLRLRERLRGQKPQANSIKEGTVSAVNDDGSYTVDGRAIQAVGTAAISAGEKVDVAWKDGRPKVILAHNARRAQFVPPLGDLIFPVVEELFLPDSGDDRRVWFRNGTNFQPILFDKSSSSDRLIGGQVVSTAEVLWGRSSPNHFVILGDISGDPVVAVYVLNRPKPNEPFPPGFTIRATLLRLYILSDPAGPSFGTISVSLASGSGSNPMRAFSSASATGQMVILGAFFTVTALAQSEYAAVAPNGDLILRMSVDGAVTITGTQAGQASFFSYNVGQLLVNLTSGMVLTSNAPDRVVPLSIIVPVPPFGPSDFACASAGSATTSTGHNLDSGARGDATLIGARMVGSAPVINSYALVEHDDLSVSSTTLGGLTAANCYPADLFSAAVFRVIGEFAQVIVTLPAGTILTAQRVHFQASRTHVFWAKIADLAYLPSPILNLIDLRKSINAEIGTNPALVLLSPQQSIPQFPIRQMVAVRSGLIYAPEGPSDKIPPDPPYNVQFFVRGGVEPGANQIQQADLKVNGALQRVANLKKVKLPAEVLIVQSEDGDLHSINSNSLGPARASSSL